MKIFFRRILFSFYIVLICSFSFLSTPRASVLESAVLQSGSAAERQFWDKIKIIKSIFQDKVDDVALAATILYGGSSSGILSSEYDENFDKSEFTSQVNGIKSAAESNELDEKYGKSGDKTDILLAALIVMIDSSWGKIDEDGNVSYDFFNAKYSDEKYKYALAGSRLVGNMTDTDCTQDVLCDLGNTGANVFNAAFCGVGSLFDLVTSPFQALQGIAIGDTENMSKQQAQRFVTMPNVCSNGFIGGTYESIRNMSEDTEEARAKKQAAKDNIADGIIKLAELYRQLFKEDDDSCVATTSSGDYTSWKQYDDEWADIAIGDRNVKAVGCLATSVAIQIARSGTQITNLPDGYTNFNPGAFVTTLNKNGGFTSGGAFQWTGFQGLASNWKIGDSHDTNISDTATLAKTLSSELSSAAEGKYQKFIVIQIHHDGSSQHWVAVDSVSDSDVTIFDPGSSKGNTLDNNYSGWVVDSYRVMYATDVQNGQTGTSDGSGSTTNNACDSSGSIDGLIHFIGTIEGVSDSCTVRGKEGYKSYKDAADKSDVGKTTAWGITQKSDKALAESSGYSEFYDDMSNGCVEKSYIDQMLVDLLNGYVDIIKAAYIKESGGKNLTEYQYHALASVYHQWPAGAVNLFVPKLAQTSDLKTYDIYEFFLNHTGIGGIQGGLNRREAEYHLLYNGNYYLEKVGDATISESYWKKRVEVYNSENVNNQH